MNEAMAQLRKVLGPAADHYTDDQLQEISHTLDGLAELFLDWYLSQHERERKTTANEVHR